jgi:hypothetical protein
MGGGGYTKGFGFGVYEESIISAPLAMSPPHASRRAKLLYVLASWQSTALKYVARDPSCAASSCALLYGRCTRLCVLAGQLPHLQQFGCFTHIMNPHGIDAPSAHARILHPSLRSSQSHSHTLVGGSFIRAGSIWYEGGSGPQYALRNCRPQVTIGRTQLDSQNRDCKGQKRVRARAARVQRGLQTAGRHEATTQPCTPNAHDNIFKIATQPIHCA